MRYLLEGCVLGTSLYAASLGKVPRAGVLLLALPFNGKALSFNGSRGGN